MIMKSIMTLLKLIFRLILIFLGIIYFIILPVSSQPRKGNNNKDKRPSLLFVFAD
jgi:hypothetical protein